MPVSSASVNSLAASERWTKSTGLELGGVGGLAGRWFARADQACRRAADHHVPARRAQNWYPEADLVDDIEQKPPAGPATRGRGECFAVCCGRLLRLSDQRALLIADNLCLRQQLLVLHRRKPRPRLEDADRRFWVLACRWFARWQASLLIVKPETVLRWHRHGWRTYWRRRSSHNGKPGRHPIAPELRALICRMTI